MIITSDFDNICMKAKNQAELMVKNGLYSRFKLSRAARIEKAYLGCIGELAFEHYLQKENIKYSKDTTDFSIKNSDDFDFLINSKKIDIKVAKKTTKRIPSDHWTYGYPEEQNPISKDFVIIGWVDFNLKQVGFYGWITGIQIQNFPVVSKNGYAGYAYKTPNHEFKWGDLNKDFKQLQINL
tara:strand:+ start:1297 stop:1842 length:546 start_codon:yes stop_codon:yes gene_type:complete